MVRNLAVKGTFAVFTLLAATGTCSADKIAFSGNVETDMPTTNSNVLTIAGNPRDTTAQASWMTAEGKVNGWVMKDLRLSYDAASDTMYVGVNFWGVAGDVDGNGDPGVADPRTTAVMGFDPPNLGGHKSISIAFAPDSSIKPGSMGTPVIVAGVPYDKSKSGPGTNGFSVASYSPTSGIGIAYNYGANLPDHQGTLAFNPDAAHPDFEFTIKNFKSLPGLDPNKFWVTGFAGSPDGIVSGASFISGYRVVDIAKQQVPEPATVLSWSIVGAGLAWQARRRIGRKNPEPNRS